MYNTPRVYPPSKLPMLYRVIVKLTHLLGHSYAFTYSFIHYHLTLVSYFVSGHTSFVVLLSWPCRACRSWCKLQPTRRNLHAGATPPSSLSIPISTVSLPPFLLQKLFIY